jgi:hypothetical protein
MLDIIRKQLELTPENDDLRYLAAAAIKTPGRTVKIMFSPCDDIAFFEIRVEIRDHEEDCIAWRLLHNPEKVPYIHDELIRLGYAKLFLDGQREIIESQLERLRESLFKETQDGN